MNKKGTYVDMTKAIGGDLLAKAVSRGVAQADIDNDGDLDLIISNNNGSANLLINDGLPKNNWIGFHLEGITSNRQAIGSKIKITTGSGTQIAWINPSGSYLTSNDHRVVFGLNKDETVHAVEIQWPGQAKESFNGLKPNQYYKIVQGTSISNIDHDN